MEKIYFMIVSIATLLNSILIIIGFIGKAKKPVDTAIDKKFKEALQPLNENINRLDKNQCMNYLVDFIEDCKNGIAKDEIQKKRASEVYDHYTKDLHLNSYIHDSWHKYVVEGGSENEK